MCSRRAIPSPQNAGRVGGARVSGAGGARTWGRRRRRATAWGSTSTTRRRGVRPHRPSSWAPPAPTHAPSSPRRATLTGRRRRRAAGCPHRPGQARSPRSTTPSHASGRRSASAWGRSPRSRVGPPAPRTLSHAGLKRRRHRSDAVGHHHLLHHVEPHLGPAVPLAGPEPVHGSARRHRVRHGDHLRGRPFPRSPSAAAYGHTPTWAIAVPVGTSLTQGSDGARRRTRRRPRGFPWR